MLGKIKQRMRFSDYVTGQAILANSTDKLLLIVLVLHNFQDSQIVAF